MTILVVDDEKILLEMTVEMISNWLPEVTVISATSAKAALELTKVHDVNIAFLDIEMPGIGGIALAKKIVEINPLANIVFLTAYSEYALQSYEVYASGYVLKPLTKEKLETTMEHLRYPLPKEARLKVSCFGNFEVFYEDQPLHFKRTKAKELFAYLISRKGATATVPEICAALWEGEANTTSQNKYFWALVNELSRALDACGCADVMVRGNNSYAVRPKNIDCDYFKYIRGDRSQAGAYVGEFMEQYSWAEYIKGQLDMGIAHKS